MTDCNGYASKTQLMETFVRQYIMVANTIIDDPMEMRSRWEPGGMVNFLSCPQRIYRFLQKQHSANEGI